MAVDILTHIVIDCPRDAVASYTADPSNAPEWYANIKTVEWKTEPLLRVGSRVAKTKMTLRNRGEPSGFSGVVAPLLAPAMRRANQKDLARLKHLLEQPGRRGSWDAVDGIR